MKNKKILILGAARSGIAAAKVLAKDNDVVLTDMKKLNEDDKKNLNELNVDFILSNNQEEILDDSFDYLVKNPGILPSHPILKKAKELNILVINEIEVAYNYVPKNTFIIGVTGSNGKTTTVTLIEKILKKIGKDVVLGGNIGIPLCSLIKNIKEDSILLLELSDHQLMNVDSFKTNISLLVNVCPTHLDYHGTYESYKNAKRKIFNNHTFKDTAIINLKNKDSLSVISNINSNVIYFNDEDNYIDEDKIYIDKKFFINIKETNLIGEHNKENLLSALMVTKNFGVTPKIVIEALKDFYGVEHRIEFVKNIDNVNYYNDSKATNTTSAATALKTFKTPVHLILGGLEQGQKFENLLPFMNYVKCIYAIGENRNRIIEFAKTNNIKCIDCEILNKALNLAKENVAKGDTVLLSPASASNDQYKRFEDRGQEFKDIVNNF